VDTVVVRDRRGQVRASALIEMVFWPQLQATRHDSLSPAGSRLRGSACGRSAAPARLEGRPARCFEDPVEQRLWLVCPRRARRLWAHRSGPRSPDEMAESRLSSGSGFLVEIRSLVPIRPLQPCTRGRSTSLYTDQSDSSRCAVKGLRNPNRSVLVIVHIAWMLPSTTIVGRSCIRFKPQSRSRACVLSLRNARANSSDHTLGSTFQKSSVV
jgi:hypothetical protein